MQVTERPIEQAAQKDFLPLKGTDYVEFYVGNAKQAAYYYRSAFGMKLVAYRGPETGTRDRASYVVQQNKIRNVIFTHRLALDHRGHRIGFECWKQPRITHSDGRVDFVTHPFAVSRPQRSRVSIFQVFG